MIYLRVLLLFSLVTLHFIGGAALFRRLFPRESPWLGFILPALALALVCNFIEHAVAITCLPWLLAVTGLGSVWLILSPRTDWRTLWKPSLVFALAFAIPLVIRSYMPEIGQVRDGPMDLSIIQNFSMGDTLPPESSWLPGYRTGLYYDFSHYAASVAIRLFNLDLGTGFNVMSALLAGLILFCTGAIAYHVSGQRLWVALLVVVMTSTAMDGITDDLWLFHHDFAYPDDSTNLLNRTGNPDPAPYDPFVPRGKDFWATHELIPPGYWCWVGSYHSVMGGQFLVLFSLLCLVEMFNRARTNWPWIGALWAIIILINCSTWGDFLAGPFFLAGALTCARMGIYPLNWRYVAGLAAAAAVCLTPALIRFLCVGTPNTYFPPEGYTTPMEFLMQWWPVYVPWALLFFWWKRLHPAVRIAQALLPLFLLWLEHFNLGARIDTTGKMWGMIFACAWATFVPSLLALRSWTLRGVFAIMVIATGLSACFWIDYYHRSISTDEIGQLAGLSNLRTDPAKGRIFNIVRQYHHKIIITGKSGWADDDDPLVAEFSYNREYVAWFFHTHYALVMDSFDVADVRDQEVNDLYALKLKDPLNFLLTRNIYLISIWPDDVLSPETVAALQKQLAPAYTYIDCRGINPPPTDHQAGIFVYRDPADKNRLAPTIPMPAPAANSDSSPASRPSGGGGDE